MKDNPDNKDRTEYIKSIFNNDYTELTLAGRQNGRLQDISKCSAPLWKVIMTVELHRVFITGAVIAQHFEAMRLLGELNDSIKPLPSMDGQMSVSY